MSECPCCSCVSGICSIRSCRHTWKRICSIFATTVKGLWYRNSRDIRKTILFSGRIANSGKLCFIYGSNEVWVSQHFLRPFLHGGIGFATLNSGAVLMRMQTNIVLKTGNDVLEKGKCVSFPSPPIPPRELYLITKQLSQTIICQVHSWKCFIMQPRIARSQETSNPTVPQWSDEEYLYNWFSFSASKKLPNTIRDLKSVLTRRIEQKRMNT